MGRIKNERGYALVTVLLIMTIFLMISLSFMGQAFSTVKQNDVMEDQSQSVALAEMGVTYYQEAIENSYLANRDKIFEDVKKETGTTIDNYIGRVLTKLKQAIERDVVAEKQTVMVEGNPTSLFTIKNFLVNSVGNKLVISFSSEGTDGKKTTSLSTEITMDVTKPNSVSSGAGNSTTYVTPQFDEITKPVGTELADKCKKVTGIGDTACEKVLLQVAGSYGKNNNLENQTIYSTNALTFPNANNMTNVKIHTDLGFTVEKNMQNAVDLVIESKGRAEFKGQFDLTGKSRVMAKNDFVVGKHFSINLTQPTPPAKPSLVFVGGNATVDTIYIGTNSKMCVGGDLTLKQNNTTPNILGSLYIKGKIFVNGREYTSSNSKIIKDANLFSQNCGTAAQTQNYSIIWGDLVNNVDYTY